ncbi:JAB domain-containing protein [Pedobacter sp. SYP-B3415]|uniref:JAB domain-containing protein n=1 Tax=Pedobacter sp. SYP-B3415 TaxID=2496641 RepID=UPI00101BA429|nr:JAB domain-containing protein [Pedobacter sp. SYP-B3415]
MSYSFKTSAFTISEIQVSYTPTMNRMEQSSICGSRQAYQLAKGIWSKDKIALQEEFKVLLLNRANDVLGIYHVASDGVASVLADAKLVFGCALKACASAMILFHNHPSGRVLPSAEDQALTSRFVQIGQLLEITVLDHIILCHEEVYYSFADEGRMG